MLWLKIVLGIVLVLAILLVLLCRTRVGVYAAYDGASLILNAKIGLLTLHILPQKEKPKQEKKPKKEKKTKKPAERTAKKSPKKSRLPVTLADIRDAVQTLWPPLKRALGRTRRGIRIDPLRLSLTLGGQPDPPGAAERYGYLQAAVWTGMPVLEKLLDIREPHLHTGVDFEASSPAAEGEVGISIRIGTLLGVGLDVGFPALRWFLKFQKVCRQREKQAAKEAAVQKPEETTAKPA